MNWVNPLTVTVASLLATLWASYLTRRAAREVRYDPWLLRANIALLIINGVLVVTNTAAIVNGLVR